MQLPAFSSSVVAVRGGAVTKGRSHLGIKIELSDNVGDLARFGTDQLADEALDPG